MFLVKKTAVERPCSTAFVGGGGGGEKGLQHRIEPLERRWVNAVAGLCAVHRAFYQASVEQFLQVLRHGALRQRQHFHYFATNTGLPPCQFLQNGYPCRVGKCLGQFGQRLLVSGECCFFM